uniref:Centromere protein K-like protein n=1 Tax=Callorhinchus milii TaxID=7868 RepID=V9L3M0_CALMI
MAQISAPSNPPLPAPTAPTPSTHSQLLGEGNQAWGVLQQFQNSLTLANIEPIIQDPENPLTVLLARERNLIAEASVQHNRTPKPLPLNNEVLTVLAKEQLQTVTVELQQTLLCTRSKKKSLQNQLEKEERWLKEEMELETSLREEAQDNQQRSIHTISQSSSLLRIKTDMEKLMRKKERLLTALGNFLDEHYPLPSRRGKQKLFKGREENLPPLQTFHEILELLMTRTLKTPHDPYVETDDTFWPPYVEALLRYGIAVRHSQNPNRIRLEVID